MQDAFVRYLRAKVSIDDAAINRTVFAAAKAAIASGAGGEPTRVLDLGAGSCSMLVRAADWGLLEHAHYVAVDADASVLAAAKFQLSEWARARGDECVSTGADELAIRGDGRQLTVRLVHASLDAFDSPPNRFDLLIANAFFDLVDVERALARIKPWLARDARFWLTVNFDGETIFEPEFVPIEVEQRLLGVYHRSMDQRRLGNEAAGHSRTGRKLFSLLARAGARVEAAGASDWVVFPRRGRYVGEEKSFVQHIVRTIELELGRHSDVDPRELSVWLAARRAQIEAGELIYIAHQLDFFGSFET